MSLGTQGQKIDMSFCPLCIKNEGQIDKIFDMSEGQNQGQNSSLFEKKNLGNVPDGPWVQVQEQGGYASAPCNPVTLSFTLNLGAYKKRKGMYL